MICFHVHYPKEKKMKTKKIVALAVLASAILSTAHAQHHRDGRLDGRREEFRICKPYRLAQMDLTRQVNDFEGQVIRPLMNQLEDQRARVSARQSEERKLEGAVSNLRSNITDSERRLKNIPGLIISAEQNIRDNQARLPILRQELANLQKEHEDAGVFRRVGLKIKINNKKDEIENAEKAIRNRTQEIANMQAEQTRLPGQIENLRSSLVVAESNLTNARNQLPSLNEMIEREIQLRNQLDSQDETRRRLSLDLQDASEDLAKCQLIDEQAETYRELLKMAHRLRMANCDVELVRNRLPYNITEAEKRAFAQAVRMVCDPATDGNEGPGPGPRPVR